MATFDGPSNVTDSEPIPASQVFTKTFAGRPATMSFNPVPSAVTTAGSATSFPTLMWNGEPGMWTPLNLTWMAWMPCSRG